MPRAAPSTITACTAFSIACCVASWCGSLCVKPASASRILSIATYLKALPRTPTEMTVLWDTTDTITSPVLVEMARR